MRPIHAFEKEIAAIDERVQAERRARIERAAAVRDRCAQLRSRIQELSLELTALRRQIDPSQNADRFAKQLSVALRQPLAVPGTQSRLSDQVTEFKLDEGLAARLSLIARYFADEQRWKPEMHTKIARWWSKTTGPDISRSERYVFRVVSALAIVDGDDDPPSPAKFRSRWRDEEYYKHFFCVYQFVSGATAEEMKAAFQLRGETGGPKPNQLANGGEAMYTAYGRARKSLAPHLDGAERRNQTIIDSRLHRDPPRPPG